MRPAPSADDASDGSRAAAGRRAFAARSNAGGRRRPRATRQDGASAAAMAGWFRPESDAAPVARRRRPRTAGVAAARAVDRILIGAGPDGAQARIRIGAGALAGTEIQLSTGAGGHAVEARLLTHAASSRQTLSVVMDEIRSRLRDKGIVLSTRAAGAPRRRSGARRRRRRTADPPRGRGRVGGAGPVNAHAVRSREPARACARGRRARRGRRCGRCALLPERWPVELPPLGSATVSFAGIDADADRLATACELAVSFGVARGRVSDRADVRGPPGRHGAGRRRSCSRRRARSGRPRRASSPACSRRCSIASAAACTSARFRPGRPRPGRWRSISFRLETAVGIGLAAADGAGGRSAAAARTAPRSGGRARPHSGDGTRRDRDDGRAGAAHSRAWPRATRSCSTACAAAAFAPDARWTARVRVGGHAADVAVDSGRQADQVDDASAGSRRCDRGGET